MIVRKDVYQKSVITSLLIFGPLWMTRGAYIGAAIAVCGGAQIEEFIFKKKDACWLEYVLIFLLIMPLLVVQIKKRAGNLGVYALLGYILIGFFIMLIRNFVLQKKRNII